MNFKPGDRVSTDNTILKGTVVEVKGDQLFVMWDEDIEDGVFHADAIGADEVRRV